MLIFRINFPRAYLTMFCTMTSFNESIKFPIIFFHFIQYFDVIRYVRSDKNRNASH